LIRIGQFGDNSSDIEPFDSTACNIWVGITNGNDDARDASVNERFGARAGSTDVIARLERDIGCGAAGFFAGGFQRDDFGMVAPIVLMEAFANDLAFVNDDAANGGIGAGEADAFARELERALHEADVVFVHRDEKTARPRFKKRNLGHPPCGLRILIALSRKGKRRRFRRRREPCR
jgi:hypothetical protein